MEVKIGVQNAQRELVVDTDSTPDDIEQRLTEALGGNGVLRQVVRDYLHRTRQVASVADEHADRGGDGATVAVLK